MSLSVCVCMCVWGAGRVNGFHVNFKLQFQTGQIVSVQGI